MKVLITDTNVFIDLIQIGAIAYFFQLRYEICTTDLVVEEIKTPSQKALLDIFIENRFLKVVSLDATEIRAAYELKTGCNLKRITDKSVLLKAIHFGCIVLSGDADLRKECIRNGLEVHGTIWVMREIWTAGLASELQLLELLQKLAQNTRLPEKEIEKLADEIAKFS